MDAGAEHAEASLRGELGRANMAISTARPILRHMLANSDQSLFSDEVIAHIRGMLGDVARQLLYAMAKADEAENLPAFVEERRSALTRMMLDDSEFLGHAHALTIEAQLTARLQRRSGIDSVLSPLLQELAASTDHDMAASSMRVLAAQARFAQQHRRMELPLPELPGDLFHKALLYLGNLDESGETTEATQAALRGTYSEAGGRLGQITRLVMAMGRRAPRALAIDHAGLAIFATALAMASGQDRNLAIFSFGENQLARLALSLRAAGLKQAEVEDQLLYLHSNVTLPPGFEEITIERASAILKTANPEAID